MSELDADTEDLPILERALPRVMSPGERLSHVLVSILVLAVAAVLLLHTDPDPRGMGTHEQLGMAPCGWLQVRGYPCPTCGCTTAASHLLHMQPIAAFSTQPFGALLCLLGLIYVGAAGFHIVQGRSLVARTLFWPWPWILIGGLLLVLGSWGLVVWTWEG